MQHWVQDHQSGKHLLVHQIRRKMGFVDTAKAIIEYVKSFPSINILIEKAANGFAVIEILEAAGIDKVHQFSTGRNSKEQRASTVSYLFDRGDVLFPRNEPSWFEEYKRELTGFPAMRHDDQVDATTMYLAWVSANTTIDLATAFRNAAELANRL